MRREDLKEIVTMVDRCGASLSTSQLLADLQTIIERISFSKLHLTPDQQGPVSIAELDLLFEDQISQDMLGFVRWLAENEFLKIVADDVGLLFFDYCAKKYRGMQEIRFTTATFISSEFKTALRQAIYRQHSSAVRVVFEVRPSLIAGFVLEDGSRRVDKSLRTFSVKKVKEHLAADMQAHGVTHG